MAHVDLMIGASADIVSGDELKASEERVIGALRRPAPRQAIRRRRMASAVMPAAGPLVLDLDGPPADSMWSLIHVVITGADDHTAVAGASAALYVGGEPPAINAGNVANWLPPLGDLLQPGIAVPGYWAFSKETVYAHFGDSVFVVVYGAAAGTNLSAVARVHEWHPDGKEELSRL